LCWGAWGEEEYIARKIVRVDVDDDISASNIFILELDDSSWTFFCRDTMSCCVMLTKNRTSTPSTSLLPLRAIHLTRRQFFFLYEMVQISTFMLPPPQKEAT
jgi:hypothetical protein